MRTASAVILRAAALLTLAVSLRSGREDLDTLDELPYAGCKAIWLEATPRCVVDPEAPLRVWLDQPADASVAVLVDGNAWPAERYLVDGFDGFGLSIPPPLDAERLTVVIDETRSSWTLPLRTAPDDTYPPGIHTSDGVDSLLAEAYMAGEANRSDEALRLLDEAEPDATRYPKGRAELATYRGVVRWHQNRNHDAATLLRQGVAFGLKLDDPALIRDSLHTYAGILGELGYHAAAIDWIETALRVAATDASIYPGPEESRLESTAGHVYLLHGRRSGSVSPRAEQLLGQALDRASPGSEHADPSTVPGIRLTLAEVALERGDPEAALATLAAVRFDDVPTVDEHVRLREVELRALDEAGRPWPALSTALTRLEHAVSQAGTADARWRLAVRRGDVLARKGRLDEAVAAYQAAESEALRLAELAALGVGRDATVTAYGESTERLVAGLVALGRPEEALCRAREAEARRIQAVGRPTSPAEREQLDRAIDEHMAARRALDEANTAGRALPQRDRDRLQRDVARTEALRTKIVDEILRTQSTWRPRCEDLSPRAPGELLLGLYPSTRGARRGWWVFVRDDTGTTAIGLAGGPARALDDPALAIELLEPFRSRIAAATRVRVLASGAAQHVDVHRLAWNGGALVQHVPVTYGAELPHSPAAGPSASPMALVVANPTEEIDVLPQEIHAAARSLSTRGWELEAPDPTAADRERVMSDLARAQLFVFFGHGDHEPPRARALPPHAGGTAGWPARLRLAPPTMLEIHDVLTLASAPRLVTLLGCETGVPGGGGGGMSLALAFLVAGAEAVVATPEKTISEVSLPTALGLLERMSPTTPDLARDLAATQAAMLARGETIGRYRAWVR